MTPSFRSLSRLRVFCLTFVAWSIAPAVALACGAMVPQVDPTGAHIVHDAETMLYVVDDDRLTVYQGRSIDTDVEEFAWLLPVPGEPEIETAPSELFERLADVTSPSFELTDRSAGNCAAEVQSHYLIEPDGTKTSHEPTTRGGGSTLGSPRAKQSAVRQLGAGQVGVYEHTTITTRDGVDEPGRRALEWLEEQGYDLAAVDEQLLREYLEEGLNLLAFRLRTEADAEEVHPVAITVEAEQAVSPMRLAAAGATEDTEVLVWVAADHRAVPQGYAHVQIDEGLVDWRSGGRNYTSVVDEAVRQAGGRAFVTDSTMRTSELSEFLMSGDILEQWERIRQAEVETPEQRRTMLENLLEIELLDSVTPSQTEDRVGTSRRRQTDADGEFRGTEEFRTVWRETMPRPEQRMADLSVRLRVRSDDSDRDLSEVASTLRRRDITVRARAHQCLRELDLALTAPMYRMVVDVDMYSIGQFEISESTFDERFDECFEEPLQHLLKEVDRAAHQFQIEIFLENQPPSPGPDWLQRLSDDEISSSDVAKLVERIDAEIFAPYRNLQDRLASTNHLTRLFTVMGPEDMTEDVSFIEDPNAEPIEADRRATRLIQCDEESTQRRRDSILSSEKEHLRITRDWVVEPPRGTPVEGHGPGWPFSIGDLDAAYSITHHGEE